MIGRDPLLFALGSSPELGTRVAALLGAPVAAYEERDFEDGESFRRPLSSVRGRDVYVLQSLAGGSRTSPHDELCGLLFFLGALRDAGAGRVNAVVPYLCYTRQERKTRSRDPVTSRYVASLFEAVGCDRVVTLDVHDLAAFQNAFRCRTEHLEARSLFVDHFAARLPGRQVAVVSPDVGGYKRAERFRRDLTEALGREVGMVFVEKSRTETGLVGGAVVGDLKGRVAILYDDLIATGATLVRTARACRERGAVEVHAAATHGLFAGGAPALFASRDLADLVVTSSVPLQRSWKVPAGRVEVLDLAPLLASTIRCLHEEGSLSDLLEPTR